MSTEPHLTITEKALVKAIARDVEGLSRPLKAIGRHVAQQRSQLGIQSIQEVGRSIATSSHWLACPTHSMVLAPSLFMAHRLEPDYQPTRTHAV